MVDILITVELLNRFNACAEDVIEFGKLFPDGLDISGLWGTGAEADAVWRMALAHDWLKRRAGRGIGVGLLPAKIRANLEKADLREANLGGANLWGANLGNVKHNRYTIWPAGFEPPKLGE